MKDYEDIARARIIGLTQSAIPECVSPEHIISYAARVSNPANQENVETAPRLLAYLQRNREWSPFEMAHMTVEVVTTRDIGRQILRHRSAAFQEFSQRYAEVMDDLVFRECRMQDPDNRQSSLPCLDDAINKEWIDGLEEIEEVVTRLYKRFLGLGIAKECARVILPEGMTQSTLFIAGSVRTFIHYAALRTEEGTQKEHRIIGGLVEDLLLQAFPSLKKLA